MPDPEGLGILAEVADLAFFQVDENRDIVAVSPALERITGFRAEDVIGRSCLTMIRCRECLRGCGVFEDKEVKDVPLTLYQGRWNARWRSSSRAGPLWTEIGSWEPLRPSSSWARCGDPRAGTPPELDTLLDALGRYFIIADGEMRVVGFSSALPELLGVEAETGSTPRRWRTGSGKNSSARRASSGRPCLSGQRREGWRATIQGRRWKRPHGLHLGGPHFRVHPLRGLRSPPEHHGPDRGGTGGGRPELLWRDSRPIPFHAKDLPGHRSSEDNDSTVLVTGESGTGKELVARAVHEHLSPKGTAPSWP